MKIQVNKIMVNVLILSVRIGAHILLKLCFSVLDHNRAKYGITWVHYLSTKIYSNKKIVKKNIKIFINILYLRRKSALIKHC